jgi:hypothetical protein
LVAIEAGGRISGFIGVHSRRAIFRERPIRVACGGQLVTDPAARSLAPGFFLLKAVMEGPQDLTITDTAVEATRRMWVRLGGVSWELASISWLKVFRPGRYGITFLSDRFQALRPLTQPLAAGADTANRLSRRRTTRGDADIVLEAAGYEALIGLLPELTSGKALRPLYDRVSASWIAEQMARTRSRGALRIKIGRRGSAAVGLVVYYANPGGISDVLLIAARPGAVAATIEALFREARDDGLALLRGRIEPGLVEPLSQNGCLLRYNGGALIHAQDPQIPRSIEAGEAFLTRVDGEFWAGHHLEPFG